MSTQKIAIIGGSAAGFYAAHQLARAGLRVCVYEASDALQQVRRTLIVTDKFREQMGELASEAIVNEIRTFGLFANGDHATVQLQRPDLIVERTEVINVLAEQARKAGAEVVTRQRLVGLEPAVGDSGESGESGSSGGNGSGAIRLTVEPTDRRFGGDDRRTETRTEQTRRCRADERTDTTADVVIGADGAFSTVARLAGWPQQPTVPLVQAIVTLPDDVPADETRVWFVPEDTPYFYWLIPEGNGRAGVGIIGDERPDGKNARQALEGFLERQGLRAIEFQAGRIPLYVKWIPVHRKVGRGDVYLVGDAAGQVKVTTVGGIVTGFRGAQGVVDALLHPRGNGGNANGAAARGVAGPPSIQFQPDNGATNGEIRGLRRELDLHLWIRRAMHEFDAGDYSKLLLLLSESAKSQLGRFHRDETWRLMRNLTLRQPRLALLGLKNLLRGGRFGSDAL